MRCVRCGEPHTFEQCPKKDNPGCPNCGEAHSAAYNGCKEAKKANQIQKIKCENKLSYAQATKVWGERRLRPEPVPKPIQVPVPTNPIQQSEPQQDDFKEPPSTFESRKVPSRPMTIPPYEPPQKIPSSSIPSTYSGQPAMNVIPESNLFTESELSSERNEELISAIVQLIRVFFFTKIREKLTYFSSLNRQQRD